MKTYPIQPGTGSCGWRKLCTMPIALNAVAGSRASRPAPVRTIATARPTGKQVKMPFRECFTLRDGLVVDLQPFYYDTAAIAAAFAG